jgi:exodeoxyribonuclease-3
MQLLSWNVNGLRSVLGKTLPGMMQQVSPDVICFQEIKALQEQVPDMAWAGGCHECWCSAQKKGYSGTLVLSRTEPLSVAYGLGLPEHDAEGRVITAEFDDFYLVNVYTPNSKPDLSRLAYRTEVWDPLFLAHLKRLEETKPVVTCGDFNVAHKELDIARPKQNERTAGFTIEERSSFDRYIDAGFLDTFREFEKDGGHYSWWSQMFGARQKNIGWRIDYFLISASLRPRLKRAFIMPEVLGSDHCPVGIELD